MVNEGRNESGFQWLEASLSSDFIVEVSRIDNLFSLLHEANNEKYICLQQSKCRVVKVAPKAFKISFRNLISWIKVKVFISQS